MSTKLGVFPPATNFGQHSLLSSVQLHTATFHGNFIMSRSSTHWQLYLKGHWLKRLFGYIWSARICCFCRLHMHHSLLAKHIFLLPSPGKTYATDIVSSPASTDARRWAWSPCWYYCGRPTASSLLASIYSSQKTIVRPASLCSKPDWLLNYLQSSSLLTSNDTFLSPLSLQPFLHSLATNRKTACLPVGPIW